MTTITRQVACIRRELAVRYRVYPTLVAQGRMTQAMASEELACMQDILASLERGVLAQQGEQPSLFRAPGEGEV